MVYVAYLFPVQFEFVLDLPRVVCVDFTVLSTGVLSFVNGCESRYLGSCRLIAGIETVSRVHHMAQLLNPTWFSHVVNSAWFAAAGLPGVDAEIAGFVPDSVIADKILQTLACELNPAPTQAPQGLFTLSQVEQARRVLRALSGYFANPSLVWRSASVVGDDDRAEDDEDEAEAGAAGPPSKVRGSLSVHGCTVQLKLHVERSGSSECGADDDDAVDDTGPVTRLAAAAARAGELPRPVLDTAVQASLVVHTGGTVQLVLLALERTEVTEVGHKDMCLIRWSPAFCYLLVYNSTLTLTTEPEP